MLRNPKAKPQDNNYQQKGEKDEKGNQKRIPTPSTFTSHCPPKENVETAQTEKRDTDDLRSFATETTGKLHILGLNGNSFAVDST